MKYRQIEAQNTLFMTCLLNVSSRPKFKLGPLHWCILDTPIKISCDYLGAHIGFDFPGVWMHFDIAAPVESVGIRLLYFGWRNGVLLALLLFIGFFFTGRTCNRLWRGSAFGSFWEELGE